MAWVTVAASILVIAVSAFQLRRPTNARNPYRSSPRIGLAMGAFFLINAGVRLARLDGVTGNVLELVSIGGMLVVLVLTIRQQQRNLRTHLADLEAKRQK